jgi:hypothetical protein
MQCPMKTRVSGHCVFLHLYWIGHYGNMSKRHIKSLSTVWSLLTDTREPVADCCNYMADRDSDLPNANIKTKNKRIYNVSTMERS